MSVGHMTLGEQLLRIVLILMVIGFFLGMAGLCVFGIKQLIHAFG